jgi:hypothetical protein
VLRGLQLMGHASPPGSVVWRICCQTCVGFLWDNGTVGNRAHPRTSEEEEKEEKEQKFCPAPTPLQYRWLE